MSAEKSQRYAGLMKAYSTLTAAAAQIRTENNNTFVGLVANDTHADLASLFQEKLKVQKYCADPTSDTSCYDDKTIKTLENTTANSIYNGRNRPALLTTDGMVYFFHAYNVAFNCNYSSYQRLEENEACGAIYVDINGSKPPNRLGMDVFNFNVNKYNLTPYNNPTVDYCPYESSSYNGLSCGARALLEEKITYY